jgi:hypothetical protein
MLVATSLAAIVIVVIVTAIVVIAVLGLFVLGGDPGRTRRESPESKEEAADAATAQVPALGSPQELHAAATLHHACRLPQDLRRQKIKRHPPPDSLRDASHPASHDVSIAQGGSDANADRLLSRRGIQRRRYPTLAVIWQQPLFEAPDEQHPPVQLNPQIVTDSGRGHAAPTRSSLGSCVERIAADGAAQESNLPSLGLPDLTGFEDRLRHRPLAAPPGA